MALAALAGAPQDAAAKSPVEIVGVDGDLRDQIRDALPDRDRPQSLFDAERIADEAAERARALLRSEGWYAAIVEAVAEDAPPRAILRIAPGARFTLADPALTFEPGAPIPEAEQAAREALAELEPGAPARAEDVLAAEAAALRALREAGYARAETLPSKIVVDHATNTLSATFAYNPGDRIRLGDLVPQPPDLLREQFVEKLQGWESGQPYDPTLVDRARRDVSGTGAFAVVATDLAEAPGPDGLTDVVLRLEPAEPRVLELGAGYSTTEGLGLEGEWTRRNLTGRADALTLRSVLAETQQVFAASLRRPASPQPGQTLTYAAALSRDDTEAFERYGATASFAVDSARRLAFALSYGAALSYDTYAQAAGVENALVLSGFGEVRRDTTQALLDPLRGYILEARLEPGVSTGDATAAFVRTTTQARGYWTPSERARVTVAGRLRLGWIEPLAGSDSDLPLDRLFYAGGGGSVRGYAFNSIFPEARARSLTDPPGGRGLLETAFEARTRVTDTIGIVAFVEGGSAFNSWDASTDLLWGAGIGLRYDLGFAPLRVDVATPLDPRETDDPVAIYVSIGQAF